MPYFLYSKMPLSDKLLPNEVFDEAEVLVAAGLGLGMNQEDVGRWAITAQYPNGVSGRSVRTWISGKPDAFERLITRIKGAVAREHQEFADLTREQYRERLLKLRHKSVRVKEQALDAAIENPTDPQFLAIGVRVAEGIENRDLGMAKQLLEVGGNVSHDHFLFTAQTRAELLTQELEIEASQKLLSSLPSDVIEAEVLADA